jgi:hypothetical protein
MLSRTTDGGRAWSTPIQIVPPVANEHTIGNVVVVDPRDDTVYDFYMYIHADNSFTIEDVASHDGVLTWGPRQLVSDSQTVGVFDPASSARSAPATSSRSPRSTRRAGGSTSCGRTRGRTRSTRTRTCSWFRRRRRAA